MSKTKIQAQDQSNRISKLCCTPMLHYAGGYYIMYDRKTCCTELLKPQLLPKVRKKLNKQKKHL